MCILNYIYKKWLELKLFTYLLYSFLFKVDLPPAYKKLINVNINTAYTSVNKRPSNNDNNKTKYLLLDKTNMLQIDFT